MKVHQITKEEVKFSVSCCEEHSTPDFTKENGEEDEALNREILARSRVNQWAWCNITVMAILPSGDSASDDLGCCSYKSEEDFKNSSSHYEDMCNDALDRLNHQIQVRAEKALQVLIHFCEVKTPEDWKQIYDEEIVRRIHEA